MNILNLASIDNQLFLVNCKIDKTRIVAGYAFFGFIQQDTIDIQHGTQVLKVKIPENALNQYGCAQFNVILDLESC